MIDTRKLKQSISNTSIPDDLKNSILTTEDSQQMDQFLTRFFEWRRNARFKDGEKK